MTPDQIRRSWDDDDTPRSVFPEPLAERLTRENKELRAEVERLREELTGALATIKHQCEGMSWIAGHDRQGLDHLRESIEATARAEAAEQRLNEARELLAAHSHCVLPPFGGIDRGCSLFLDLRDVMDNGRVNHLGHGCVQDDTVTVAAAALDKHAGEQP